MQRRRVHDQPWRQRVRAHLSGSVRVETQDAAGKPRPGFTLDECPEIIRDQIERVVAWQAGADVGKLAEQPIRLRFVMKDARTS